MNLTENEKQLVIGIVSDSLVMDLNKINPDSNLKNNLGADSLDAVDIVMRLEDEFDISIPDHEYTNNITIEDLFEIVDRYLN